MNQLKPIFRLVLITIFAASGLIGCVGDDSGTETVAVTVRSEGVPLGTSTQPDSDSLRIPIDGSGGTSGDGDTGSDGSHAEGAENGTENGTENTETGAGEIVPDPLSLAGGRMNWRLDRDEQYTFNVEGGVEPYSWSVVGQVDPRLDIRLQDGVLHAHPRVAGKFDVKVRVTDHHNSSQEKEFRIKVAEGFTLSAKLCKATRDAAGKITACSEEGATLANPAPNVVLDKDHVLKLEVDGHAERYQWTVNHQDLEIVSRATSSGRTTSKTRDRENRRMRFLQLKGEFRNVTLPTVTVTAKDDGDNRDLWTATDVVAQERVNTLESMRAYFSNDDGENKVKLNDAHYDSLMVRGGTPPYSIKEVRSTLLRSGGFCELYEVAEGKSYVTKANTWELTPKNEHEFALNGAFKYTVPITVDSFTHYCDHVTEVLMVSVQDQTGKVDTATKSFSIQYPTDRESGFEGTIKFQARDLLLNLTEIAVELLDQQGTVKYRSEALPLYPYSGDAGNCHFNEDEGDGYCINE
ncbi:MAG: hypothetical protein HY540_05430, partial [Deltaproteobacteria bacterium]|nr:hypothetical protein [Deltaproteobacteria bacterium]